MVDSSSVAHARSLFPRGLFQPQGSFRFSIDALLLAAFSCSGKPFSTCSVADLGTGCGVVAISLLLQRPSYRAVGVELSSELVRAAKQNAQRLGLEEQFSPVCADLHDVRSTENLRPESFDVVVSNPPYRRKEQGRHSATQQRTNALFETTGSLQVFVESAAYLVRNKGLFYCIYPAERMVLLLAELRRCKLEPKRMQMVHSKAGKGAQLLLLEARKNGNPGCTVAPPLVLYAGEGEKTYLTQEAIDFCPYLGCNAARI